MSVVIWIRFCERDALRQIVLTRRLAGLFEKRTQRRYPKQQKQKKYMRNYNKTIGALAAITALSAGVASAEIEGEVYAGYASSYNFRGIELGDNLAESGLNLSYDCQLTQGEFNVGVWYGSTNDSKNSIIDDQLQTSVSWSKELGFLDLSVGFINYDFKGSSGVGDFTTSEVFLTLSKELYEGIRASVSTFYDVDLVNGWYFEGALSKSFALTECINLDLAAGASFYQSYETPLAGFASDGFNHWFASVALPVQARENLLITPYVRYVDVRGSQFSGGQLSNLGGGDDEIIGGIRANVSF